jgi:hypothetical protein
MAELYKKNVPGVTFACYSERGIVAYFMLRVLPTDPAGFLREIVEGGGAMPFAKIQSVGHGEESGSLRADWFCWQVPGRQEAAIAAAPRRG